MAQRLAILLMVAILLAGGGLPVLAQNGSGGERPACTAEDVEPVSRLVIAMIDSLGQSSLSVDDQLGWRAEIAALDAADCAGMRDALLQLQLAADELLIGALLLERAAGGTGDSAATDAAALAINSGLTNLVGMRFALRGGDAPAAADGAAFGDLDGEAVLAAFRAAGLPVGAAEHIAVSDSAAPREQIAFSLEGLPEGEGGQILVFADAAGRDAWLADLLTGEAEPGYLYLHRNVIVRLSPALDGATARQFRTALRGIG